MSLLLLFNTPPSGAATLYTLNLSATNGAVGVPVTLTYVANGASTVTVTPGSAGVAGTYSPATVTLNGTTPVTQTFTPSATGTASFSPTNSGLIANPGTQTYTVNPAGANSYTLNLSASSGSVGTPVTLTYVANGPSTVTITPGSAGISGVYSPATVNLNGTTPVTQTFTPSAAGTATFTPTNSGILANPASQNYTATSSVATSYTLALSAASGLVGVPVTLSYAGNGTTTAIVTPINPGVAGTFSPATVTLNGTSVVTQTWTPSVVGTASFTSSNSGTLINPAARTYTVTTGIGSVAVSIGYILTGTNTNWVGTPFSIVNPNGATITYQGVVDATHACIIVQGTSSNTGPYQLSDGVILNITLPQVIPIPGTTALIAVNVSSGGSR